MEQRQKGEQFRILDPALPSAVPAAPNRLRLMLVSVRAVARIGRRRVVLAEALDTSFHSRDEPSAASPPCGSSASRGSSSTADARRQRWRLLARRDRDRAGPRAHRWASRTTSPTATIASSDGDESMYLRFYGLNEKPFATTPDPRFLYLTPGHQEALAHLVYAVQDNTGFLVLTGEVGTGKTSLLQALLKQLDGSTTVAFIVNSGLSFDGILEYMLEEFGIPTPASVTGSASGRATTLPDRARTRRAERRADSRRGASPGSGRRSSRSACSRTSRARRKSTSRSCSSASPSSRPRWRSPSYANSSSGSRCGLSSHRCRRKRPGEYIRWRLQTAGARDLDLFTERAIGRIAAYAGGIPRIVNIVCEHGLLIGYADQKRRVDIDVAERAIRYLEDGEEPRKARPDRRRRGWLLRPAASQE